jgi:hypothetical protein
MTWLSSACAGQTAADTSLLHWEEVDVSPSSQCCTGQTVAAADHRVSARGWRRVMSDIVPQRGEEVPAAVVQTDIQGELLQ